MKYLKRFNESFNIESIHRDIFDILVELSDSGFKIDLSSPSSDLVSVEIRKTGVGERETFLWRDIEEYLIRVRDYLSGFGFRAFAGWGRTESVRRTPFTWEVPSVETETKCWVKFIFDFPID